MEEQTEKKGLRQRLIEKSHSKYGLRTLYFISFLESIFFPIPPDLIMIPMIAAKPESWKKIAFWVTVFSVLGAVVAYGIGALFFDTAGSWILEKYNLFDEMETVSTFLKETTFWSFLFVSFTPLPDKLFNIAGGFFRVSLPTIAVAIFIGRGIRFWIVAYISHLGGKKVVWDYLKKFKILTWSLVGVFILFCAYWFFIK